MFSARHEGTPPTVEDARAAAANQLVGICIALDPKGYAGLEDLVRLLWRGPTDETQELQARPPNPGPAADPAEVAIAPPPVDAAVFDALQPMVQYAIETRGEPDDGYFAIETNADGIYKSLRYSELRALIRAAGLWTDDMLPRSDDDAAVADVQDAAAVAPVRAGASVEDASHAGSSSADHNRPVAPPDSFYDSDRDDGGRF
jgi:hypothetical protein